MHTPSQAMPHPSMRCFRIYLLKAWIRSRLKQTSSDRNRNAGRSNFSSRREAQRRAYYSIVGVYRTEPRLPEVFQSFGKVEEIYVSGSVTVVCGWRESGSRSW